MKTHQILTFLKRSGVPGDLARRALGRIAADAAGLLILDWFDSPITGGDGNREFFFHAIRRPGGDTHRSKP